MSEEGTGRVLGVEYMGVTEGTEGVFCRWCILWGPRAILLVKSTRQLVKSTAFLLSSVPWFLGAPTPFLWSQQPVRLFRYSNPFSVLGGMRNKWASWATPWLLGKQDTHYTLLFLFPWKSRWSLLALCSAALGEGWCRWRTTVLTPCNASILRFFAPKMCWDLSAGLLHSHKGTLFCRWLLKSVFLVVVWEIRPENSYSAIFLMSHFSISIS